MLRFRSVRKVMKKLMLPIISIVGRPGSGKSAMAESLAGEFGNRGHRVTIVRQGGQGTPGRRYADAVTMLAEGGIDLVIVDGMECESDPRIELHRSGTGDGLLNEPDDLLAAVSDTPLQVGCPRFSMEETGALADLIEEKLTEAGKDWCVLLINGTAVPLARFPQEMITKTISGMVSSLKGDGEVRSVSIITRHGTGSPRRPSGGSD